MLCKDWPTKRKNTDASPNPAKKSRQGDFKLNLNYALDKEHEAKSFKEILELPPHALQGLAPGADDLLKKNFGVSNVKELAEFKYFKRARAIKDLGNWKFCKWAEAIVECAASELDVDQSIAK